jgi:hypothetical protein
MTEEATHTSEEDITAGEVPDELRQAVARVAPLAFVAGSAGFVVIPLVVAFVIGLATSFGRSVHPAFYTTIAQVLPILMIASVTTEGFNRLMSARSASPLEPILDLASVGLMFVVGEGCALYAVAAETTSTFLLLVICMVAISTVGDIMGNVLVVAGLRKPPRGAEAQLQARLERMWQKRLADGATLSDDS